MTWEKVINDAMSHKHLSSVGIFGINGDEYQKSPDFPVSLNSEIKRS